MIILITLLGIALLASIIIIVMSYFKLQQCKDQLELMKIFNEMEIDTARRYRDMYHELLRAKQAEEQEVLNNVLVDMANAYMKENDVQLAVVPTGITAVDLASGFTLEDSRNTYEEDEKNRVKADYGYEN